MAQSMHDRPSDCPCLPQACVPHPRFPRGSAATPKRAAGMFLSRRGRQRCSSSHACIHMRLSWPDLHVRAWQQPPFGINTCLQHCPTQSEGARLSLLQMKRNHPFTHKHARAAPRRHGKARTHTFSHACTHPGTRTEATNASAGFWASSCMREPAEPELPLPTLQPLRSLQAEVDLVQLGDGSSAVLLLVLVLA